MVEWRKHIERTIREPRYAKWVLADKLKERRTRKNLRTRYFAHLAGKESAPLPFGMNLFLTEVCNLACGFCEYAHLAKPRTMEYSKVALILRQAAQLGVRQVNFTGGEPLTHPDYFRIQDFTRELGMRSLLSTNGILLSRYAERFRGWEGSIFVSVSVDGARSETHDSLRGMPGGFEKTIAGVKALSAVLDADMIELTFLVTNRNVGELSAAAKLARELGVWFNINPIQGAPDFYLSGESAQIYLEQLNQLRKTEYKIKTDWDYYVNVLHYHKTGRLPIRCGGLGLSFAVDVEGYLKPCCVWDHPFRAGNVFETPLEELWHSEAGRGIRQALYDGKCPASCYNISYLKDFLRITGKSFLTTH